MNRTVISKVGKAFFSFCTIISPTLNTKLRYRRAFKKNLNLSNPQTFNEKILWLKLKYYIDNPLVIQCADKYLVREYVEQKGLGNILVPLIGVYDSAYDIDWGNLPEKFVLKWNYGATMNIICPNKLEMKEAEVKKQLNEWRNVKYWLPFSEMQYKYIPKKIICEEFLNYDESGDLPDYKIFCFNGSAKYIMVCVDRSNNEKNVHAKYFFYDMDWNLMPYSNDALKYNNVTLDKPRGLDYAIKCAEELARPFPFVRADFYIINGKVYFGELTFTPAGGIDTDLLNGDIEMGKLIDLSEVKNRRI